MSARVLCRAMTTATQVPHLFQNLGKSTLLSGILAVVLGALVLFWPGKSLIVAAVLFGAYLLVSGVAQILSAFALHASAGSRILLFISGAASLILAVLAFRHFGEGYALLLLAIWVGIGFIFRGVATVAMSFSELKGTPGRVWSLFFGVITVIAGIVMLGYPFDSLVTLTLVVGIWLIVIGVFEIIAGIQIRKAGGEVSSAVKEALGTR